MLNEMRGTILVVDDVPENITVLASVLRDQYRVIVATSGADALEVLQNRRVDMILLDVMMPDMDGYEVCRRLKSNIATRDIPIIFVSALGATSDETYGLELGAVDYLHKPCPAAIVQLRVRMHMESHNQKLALERMVQERTHDLEDTRAEIVRCLGRAAEYRDNETGMHVLRMSKSSAMLALAAGVSKAQADLLLNTAPMHDLGKIGIPDSVLTKPGPLTPAERAQMNQHPLIGAAIIGEHPSALMQMARSVALTHHERWDGMGYPHGLKQEEIPLEGRIVAIADVFDALTSVRPYKKAWSIDETVGYMQAQSAKAFDPRLLSLFITLIPKVQEIRRQHDD